MAANDINGVFVTGNLARDAQLNKPGTALNFTVAVASAGRDGEERTDWIPCVVFGKGATALQKYLTKGKEVSIMGRLRSSSYEKDGEKRSKLEVVADKVKFGGGAQRNGGGAIDRASAKAAARDEDAGDDLTDYDEVPG